MSKDAKLLILHLLRAVPCLVFGLYIFEVISFQDNTLFGVASYVTGICMAVYAMYQGLISAIVVYTVLTTDPIED